MTETVLWQVDRLWEGMYQAIDGFSFEVDRSVPHYEIPEADLCNPTTVYAANSRSSILRAGAEGQFAIKVLDTDERARAEYDVLWRLSASNCQGIPMAYCFGHASDGLGKTRPAIVMQYIDGVCLADIMRNGHGSNHGLPMDPLKASSVAIGLAELLGALAKEGVAHGDISLRNVMVAGPSRSELYLIDFGNARTYDPEGYLPPLYVDGCPIDGL